MRNRIISKGSIDLGRVDYYGSGRYHSARLTWELRETDKGSEFSACGEIFHTASRSFRSVGQNLEECLKLASASGDCPRVEIERARRLVSVWREWHLNGMNAGTPEQTAALKGIAGDYDAQCAALKASGLYEVEIDGKPYKYGTAWLYRPLPDDVLAMIRAEFRV